MVLIPGRQRSAQEGLEVTLRAAREGDLQACNRLVRAHEASVYNVAYRVLGDEAEAVAATETAFVGAVRGLRAYREGPFSVWVLRWLVKGCAPILEKRGARGMSGLPGRVVALPPVQRLALALVDIAGLDYERTAVVLGLSVGEVGCELAAARRAVGGG